VIPPKKIGYLPEWASILFIFIIIGGFAYFFWIGKPSMPPQPLVSNSKTMQSSNNQADGTVGTVVNNANTSYNSPMSDSEGMLLCNATKDQDTITISYTFTNTSKEDLYVADATPALDANKNAFAEHNDAAIWLSDGTIHILKGFAPMPPQPVTHAVSPLAMKVAAGTSLERTLVVPLVETTHVLSQPDRDLSSHRSVLETNPYYGAFPLNQYEFATAKGAVFTIEYYPRATGEVEYAPAAYRVEKNGAARVSCALSLSDLTVLKYPGQFPRP
jgi:hypothetical protein